ncbi:MAG: PAS domain S-box protein [Chloroflexales bacterium]
MQHIDAARLLTHVPVGVVVVSPQDQIVYANPAFCYLHDYTSEDVIGRRPIALIHPEDRMIGVIAGQQLAMGLINEIVFVRRHLRRDGTIIRLRARVTTLREVRRWSGCSAKVVNLAPEILSIAYIAILLEP